MATIKIFLASSGELKEDREPFEVFINRKNSEWKDCGAYLELIVWEDFLDAVSQIRLQDEYKKAIRESDVYVMLFRTKVGQQTEEEFATAFGQFNEASKPFIFIYFKDAQISTASANRKDLASLWAFQERLAALGRSYTVYKDIDELTLQFDRQLEQLAASGFVEFNPDKGEAVSPGDTVYRAELSGGGAVAQGSGATAVGAGGVFVGGHIKGSINTGTQMNVGGHFIAGDFVRIVANAIGGGDEADDARSVIAHYLDALATDLAGLRLGEIDVSATERKREPLQLADIYVPLDTTLQIAKDTTLAQWLSRTRDRDWAKIDARRETRPVSALEALATHRELTVLGKPGSGKSTFGASVVLTLAQAWQGHRDELAKLGEGWTHDALLPIRVILRRFAEQLPPGDEPARAGDLWTFIGRDLETSGFGLSTNTMKYVQRIARDHGALILFDGLDECGDSARRERVLSAVQEMMRTAGPKCRFVLTARPYAWPSGPEPEKGVYALADLSDDQIEQFIRAWYTALVTRKWLSPGEAERKVEDLLAARKRPDLRPLAVNPLLLTLMSTLHTNRGRLPDDRADLYDESVELLLLRWNRQIGADKALLAELAVPSLKLSDLREVLEDLAFNVHEQNVGKEGAADIGEDRLVRAFLSVLNDSKDKADVVVDYIEKRAGLLIGQGEKEGERQFTFPHRTFQEFLAACHLAAQDNFAAECARLGRAAPGHWQVVLPLAARVAKAERGVTAADELIGGRSISELRATRKPNPSDWTCALLAGTQLQEMGIGAINKTDRTRAIAARVVDWLAASLPVHPDDGGAEAAQRAQTGDVLAALGDPRFDPQRFYLPADDMLGFVQIPADPEFRIGTRKVDAKRVAKIIGREVGNDEFNDAVTPTPEFCIARYPVTVSQFRAFVDAAKFQIGDADALRDPETRPVRYVSWHEALAYCDWLNGILIDSPQLASSPTAALVRADGWRVGLPSELEWEKAARGGLRDAVYSWGDGPDRNRANNQDSGISDTSAVGCFPANGLGLYDMIGNVWEWTRSAWMSYPYDPDDSKRERLGGEVARVVRGGSWFIDRDGARCAFRYGSPPDGRSDDFGFRVVLRSSPVS